MHEIEQPLRHNGRHDVIGIDVEIAGECRRDVRYVLGLQRDDDVEVTRHARRSVMRQRERPREHERNTARRESVTYDGQYVDSRLHGRILTATSSLNSRAVQKVF